MPAAVLAFNPLLLYCTGSQLSIAAVFGILLLREPLNSPADRTLLRPFDEPPRAVSRLISVSLAARVSTVGDR